MTAPEKRAGKKLYGSNASRGSNVHGPGSEHRHSNGTTDRIRRASKRKSRVTQERFDRENPS